MGGRQSRTEHHEGAGCQSWHTAVEETYEVSHLERSTVADRRHNSLGLPDDVIALIATLLVHPRVVRLFCVS